MAGSTKPKEILATLDAMLLVVTSDQPFQPVLAASIDSNAWRAVFVQQCKLLAQACNKAGASNTIREACGKLREFAWTVFGDSYFDHFHATIHRDRDAEEFGPDDDFFDTDQHWLDAARTAKPAIADIEERLRLLEERWNRVCRCLSNCLVEGKYAPVFPALLALGGTKKKKREVLDWLSPAKPGPMYERRSREKRVHAEAFVTGTLLPNLNRAVEQAFPGKGRKECGNRQNARKKIENAAADVLAAYHLRQGWQMLRGHATAVAALRSLLAAARGVPISSGKQPTPRHLSGSPLLKTLRRLSTDVLDPLLKQTWDKQLKDPTQLQTIISSLHMLADGCAAIGQDTLGNRLRTAEKGEATNGTGWTEKADERLRTLGKTMLAIHGAENWIIQSISAKKSAGFRKPREGYSWLVNPLLVLWDPVYKAL